MVTEAPAQLPAIGNKKSMSAIFNRSFVMFVGSVGGMVAGLV